MSADVRKLEQRIARLEAQVNTLLGASLPSSGGSLYKMIASESDDRMISLGHDNIDTYPDAVGYINANRGDPASGTTGSFDHGGWWDSNNFGFVMFYLGNIDIYIKESGTGRYVMEMSYATINLNVPIKAVRLTTTERNALTAATGMIIFNTTTTNFEGYNGSSWVTL